MKATKLLALVTLLATLLFACASPPPGGDDVDARTESSNSAVSTGFSCPLVPVMQNPIVPIPDPKSANMKVFAGVSDPGQCSQICSDFTATVCQLIDVKGGGGLSCRVIYTDFVMGNAFEPHIPLFISVLWSGMCTNTAANPLTNPAVFDAGYYLSIHGDLQAAFGGDTNAATNHWVTNGAKEGRRGSPNFWSQAYVAKYPDLQAAFGTNWEAAIKHYLTNGIAEGRTGN